MARYSSFGFRVWCRKREHPGSEHAPMTRDNDRRMKKAFNITERASWIHVAELQGGRAWRNVVVPQQMWAFLADTSAESPCFTAQK